MLTDSTVTKSSVLHYITYFSSSVIAIHYSIGIGWMKGWDIVGYIKREKDRIEEESNKVDGTGEKMQYASGSDKI